MISTENRYELETIFHCFRAQAILYVQDNIASVDACNFASRELRFVEHLMSKTNGNRKFILTYSGYRNHITLKNLGILRDGGQVAYCLPAQMSGTTHL